eukprot:TRINITY_DN2861_c0_g1_i1.p2 TRINITY_DN2861_c0_g1~~TRINITY_DN2861_c0_g1_i1.p2  ORF type:complete len:455 (+),score=164.98 TRINITY_DN2861_c0_g1_i1:51-1367(+)
MDLRGPPGGGAVFPRPDVSRVQGLRGKKHIRLLSLDGGGIRGLVPALFLQHMEQMTGKRVCEMFDMIAGTSTGGLLALLCARPAKAGSSVPHPTTTGAELVKLYRARGSEIFPPTRPEAAEVAERSSPTAAQATRVGAVRDRVAMGATAVRDALAGTSREVAQTARWLAAGPKYPAKGLEKVLDDYCNLDGVPLTLRDAVVPVFVSTVETAKPWGPCFFSSLDAQADGGVRGANYMLKDVARATSAAPTFLPATKFRNVTVQEGALLAGVHEMTCIDGGVCCNNPSLAAYNYVRSIADPDAEVTVVSIGTGLLTQKLELAQMDGFGVAHWLQPLLETMMNGGSQLASDQLELMAAGNTRTHHYRFQFAIPEEYTTKGSQRGAACEQMDNTQPSNLEALEKLTREYIEQNKLRLVEALERCKGQGPPSRGGYTAARPGR